MPTIIQKLYSASGSATNTLVFTGVEVGDTLIVCGATFNGPSGATCIDDTLNVYEGPYADDGGGFGFLRAFQTVAQTAGTVTVIVTCSGVPSIAIGLNYRDMGIFDQCCPIIGEYTPADPTYPFGVGTSPYTWADTVAVSFVADATGAAPGPFVFSDSGDTLIYEPMTAGFYVFQKNVTGPGNSQSFFKCSNGAASNLCPVLTLTFSKALARPDGLDEQSAFRGGLGFEAEDTPINESKVPLVASLPYAVELGNPVVVGVSYTGCSPAIAALAVEDDYGNVYTQDLNNIGNSTGIAWFHTVLTNLPPAGEPFRARLTTDVSGCPGVAYQTTAMAIAEKAAVSLIGVTAAGWDHDIDASPNQTLVSGTIMGVPASTWLVGLVVYGPNAVQSAINWTALEGYTIQQKQEFIQFQFVPGNSARIGPGAILTKFAEVTGDYDVQAIGTQVGLYSEAGSIALLALTVTLPTTPIAIACPLDSATATKGVLFTSSAPVVTDDTPPDTFALLSGPAWMGIDSLTGVVSGIPNATGEVTYIEQVTDSLGNVADTSPGCSLTVIPPPIHLCSPSLLTPPPGIPGGGGSNTCAITGPYLSLLGGPLPKKGTGHGPPTPPPPGPTPTAPTITSLSPLPGGTDGTAYSFQFAATGTTGITWSATGLPSWASLSSSGLLTGTPDAAATTSLIVTATNSVGSYAKGFSITVIGAGIAPTITTTSPITPGSFGDAYSFPFAASGTAPITWSATGLPSWASLNGATGILSGVPDALATATIAIAATNGTGSDGPHNFSLTVGPPAAPPAPPAPPPT